MSVGSMRIRLEARISLNGSARSEKSGRCTISPMSRSKYPMIEKSMHLATKLTVWRRRSAPFLITPSNPYASVLKMLIRLRGDERLKNRSYSRFIRGVIAPVRAFVRAFVSSSIDGILSPPFSSPSPSSSSATPKSMLISTIGDWPSIKSE